MSLTPTIPSSSSGKASLVPDGCKKGYRTEYAFACWILRLRTTCKDLSIF